jgi:hypothetical protein
MRGQILKGEDIVGGKAENFVGVERAGQFAGGEYGGMQRFGGLVIGDEYERRSLGCAHKVGEVESSRGGGESGHTSPTRAARQMATCTLKGGGVLQVRHQFADEGKNHAVFILRLTCRKRYATRFWRGGSSASQIRPALLLNTNQASC